MQEVIEKIDRGLKTGNWSFLDEIKLDNTEAINADADLKYFFTFYDIERTGDKEPNGIVARSHCYGEAVALIKEFKKLIIRCEWSKDASYSDILSFSMKNGFNTNEILFAARAWTSKKNSLYNNAVTDISAELYSKFEYEDADFAFIICTNDHGELAEARWYIDRLNVPRGSSIHVLEISDARSMCDGYNEGMGYANSLGIRYKIYMHQDVRVINRNILFELIGMFADPAVGMIGMVGPRELSADGVMWNKPQYGNIIESRVLRTLDYQQDGIIEKYPENKPLEAAMVDGCFIATQYDMKWRSDIFDGWDFYDASQSMEFRKAGYKVVIPYMETPWVYHDFGVPSMGNYEHYRNVFVDEYLKGR